MPPASRRSGRSSATPSVAASAHCPSSRSAARTGRAPPRRSASCFGLLESAIRSETPELREQGVRIRFLGRLEELPDDTRALDRGCAGRHVRGRPADAQRRVQLLRPARDRRCRPTVHGRWPDRRPGRRGRRSRRASTPSACRDSTSSSGPGGEHGISNFLIWQAAVRGALLHGPALAGFGPDALDDALIEFAHRHRRFGR